MIILYEVGIWASILINKKGRKDGEKE